MSLGDSTSETDSIRIDHFCYTVWSIKSHSTYIGCLYAQTEFRTGEGGILDRWYNNKLRARLLKQRWGWGIAHMMMIVMAQWGILDQITAGGSVLESRYLGWGTACFNSLWNVGTQGVGQAAQLCHCEEHSSSSGRADRNPTTRWPDSALTNQVQPHHGPSLTFLTATTTTD